MTRRRRWPNEAEWARVDAIAALMEIQTHAHAISKNNRDGNRLIVAHLTFEVARLADDAIRTLNRCKGGCDE